MELDLEFDFLVEDGIFLRNIYTNMKAEMTRLDKKWENLDTSLAKLLTLDQG